MRNLLFCCLILSLPFSLSADEDTWNIVRGILAPPVQQEQSVQSVQPSVPPVVRQFAFNPDYPDVYLGDHGSELESLFLEMVLYGQAQQGDTHFVVISGRSSQGAFQKKITFADLDELLYFQDVFEGKKYDRIYFYSDRVNEADYLLLKSPRREAPIL
ncbi:hypothetical protein ACWPKO_07220 [Coraliomargarita sp. W4R53]